jgi:excinuclease ABC subunit B
MYADRETAAMRAAIDETNRRREIQVAHNLEHGITAETVKKGISDITEFLSLEDRVVPRSRRKRGKREEELRSPEELERLIIELEEEMLAAAEDLRFEYAAKLRDEIKDLRHEIDRSGAGRR